MAGVQAFHMPLLIDWVVLAPSGIEVYPIDSLKGAKIRIAFGVLSSHAHA